MIKLYRKTFIISCLISIASFALSVAFECYRSRADVLSFFENYAIGVACSGALVAVTTYLQFHAEYDRMLKPNAVAISSLVLYLYSALAFENDLSAFEREYGCTAYDGLNTTTIKAVKWSSITCLCRKRQLAFDELDIYVSLLRADFMLEKSKTDAVKKIANSKRIVELIDLALKAFPESEDKNDIREIKKRLQCFLDEQERCEVTPHDQL